MFRSIVSKRFLCAPIFQRSVRCLFRQSLAGRTWFSQGVIGEQRRWINVKKELKELHYCSGCGVQLQYDNEAAYGYIPRDVMANCLEHSKNPICQRCHKVVDSLSFYLS